MNNFLVQLAYRGAGLAPGVNVRAELALQGGESPSVALTGDAAAPASAAVAPTPSAQMLSAGSAPPQPRAVPPGAQPASLVASIGSTPQPQVQRLAGAQPTPATLPSAAIPAVAAPAQVAARRPAVTSDPAIDAAARSPVVDAPVLAPTSQVQVPMQPVSAVAAARRTSTDQPAVQTLLTVVPEIVRSGERLREATAQSPVAVLPASPERIVHVRIGAIEIHAATPAPAANAAPAAPAAVPPRAPSEGGFEAYTRLRSYAPWQW